MRELLRRWRERVLRVQVEKWEKQGEPHVLAVTIARHPVGTTLAYSLYGLFLASPALLSDCSSCSPVMARLARVIYWALLALLPIYPLTGYQRSKVMKRALLEYERRGNAVAWPKPFDWLEAGRTVSLIALVASLGVLLVALVGGASFVVRVALAAAAVLAPLAVVLQARHRRR